MLSASPVDDIRPIFRDPSSADPTYLEQIGQTKRLLERMTSDPVFRQGLAEDPRGTAQRYGLRVDAEEVRLLWDEEAVKAHRQGPPGEVPSIVQRYRAWCNEKFAYRDLVRRESIPSDPRYVAWRARQVRRCVSELGPAKAHGLIHAPCCFELCKGCSVGCWFCGVDAPKLGDVLSYTPETRQFWRGCLEVVKEVIGPAARRGFCYWATDPLDNPNYEDFCRDFAEVLGRFPQTTTAMAHKDPERVKRLLALSRSYGCELNRFSVLTLGLFEKLFEAFTAEELVYVELIPQNKESIDRYAIAGRALERLKTKPEMRQGYGITIPEGSDFEAQAYNSTIACVSGFLFNMVERSVKLISPTNADEVWPLGYRVYGQGRFETPDDLGRLLRSLIAERMTIRLRADDPVRLRRGLAFETVDQGFSVRSAFLRQTFREPAYPAMAELGQLAAEGRWSAGQVALAMEAKHGVSLPLTFSVLNRLFELGVLDDEPTPSQDG